MFTLGIMESSPKITALKVVCVRVSHTHRQCLTHFVRAAHKRLHDTIPGRICSGTHCITTLNVFMMSVHVSPCSPAKFMFLKFLHECTSVTVCLCASAIGVAGRCTSTIEPPACLSTPAHTCYLLLGNLRLHTEMGHY